MGDGREEIGSRTETRRKNELHVLNLNEITNGEEANTVPLDGGHPSDHFDPSTHISPFEAFCRSECAPDRAMDQNST